MSIAQTYILPLFFTVIGCSDFTTAADDRLSFEIDSTKPFVIELGRGSGMYGLDIVRVDDSGRAVLSRFERRPIPDSASLQLNAEQVKKVVEAANASKLTSLAKSYSSGIRDGTQWVLWIEQGTNQKAIYFNNVFPKEMTSFANLLDLILEDAGLPTATWTAAAADEAQANQHALWNRIQ